MIRIIIAVVSVIILAAVLAAGLVIRYVGRRTKRRLRRQRKRERDLLENLAAGLAHELKNPLGALNLNLELLREKLESSGGLPDDSRKRLTTIMKETHRLEDVLNNFLRYARRRPPALAPVDIPGLIEDVLVFLNPETLRAGIEVETHFDPDAATCLADASLLKQAMLNVILNAAEAMPNGGLVTITTEHNADAVSIVVTDTGTGVLPEDIPKLFDAYFSAKKGGTGLGLTITKRIIEDHNGTIELESSPGGGTTVTLTLPGKAGRPGA
ncbi:MAG: hypothetical protein J7M19_06085 [Planctomycetes bacterium]|nr:hypothetical protein [Planctomycetota bacterium]